MKTLIQSYLPVFPGFYGTIFEASEDYLIEDDHTSEDYEFDYRAYEQDASKACVNAIEFKLQELGFKLTIEYEKLNSPQYYNFSNDSINVRYTFKPGCITSIKAYLNSHKAAYAAYLTERYTDRSGFWSSYSNDVNDWLSFVTLKQFESNAHYAGSVFEFILSNEGYDDMQLYYDAIDGQSVYLDGWLKDPETFEINGITYTGNYDEIRLSWELNPYDAEYNQIEFTDWLKIQFPVKEFIFINPNQLSLF